MRPVIRKVPGGTGVPAASTAGTYSHVIPLGQAIRRLTFRVLNADGTPKANNTFWASTVFRLIIDGVPQMAQKVSVIAMLQDLRKPGESSGTNKKFMRTLGYSTENASYGADFFTYHFAEDFRYTGNGSPADMLSLGTSDLQSVTVELDLPSDANGYKIELHGAFELYNKPAGIIPVIRSKSIPGFGTGSEEVALEITDFPREAPFGALVFNAAEALSSLQIKVAQFTQLDITRPMSIINLQTGQYTAALADPTSATRALNVTGIAHVFDPTADPSDWLDLRKRDGSGRATGGVEQDVVITLKTLTTVAAFVAYYQCYAPAKPLVA